MAADQQQQPQQPAQTTLSAPTTRPTQITPATQTRPTSPSTQKALKAKRHKLLETLQEAENTILHPVMGKERLIALTDAILAIIMTILVLDLPKPAIRDWQAIWGLRQSFFSYAVSFFWIGALWTSLNRIWEHVYRVDGKTVGWTMILLFFTSFMPYTTSLDSEYFNSSAMQGFYGVVVILITVSNLILHAAVDHCNKDNPTLLTMTHSYRVSLIPDILIKILGLIISTTVWAPAVTWSLLFAWLSMIATRKLMERRMIRYLVAAREMCSKDGTVDVKALNHLGKAA